ncbi:gamma carbonic anhydrase family protein [Streptomyces poonensis]|uniref:Gamma carbonic anhydrase family protein n=1 Tax=Streptomyces poonensis TaxID=68255 RepID=A0A918QAS7_9ACTN|nr:gamma carbonic anhydrase family protein [Streptomyces poonensis]GGZ37975.1 gamma carbonic anhydrase family protein [Streptomyces poonensis]GLJ91096.1 gamma carbonic anhydrase family protein [Streptomyces poonensis]
MEERSTARGKPLVRGLSGRAPRIDPTAFLAPTAVLLGTVRVGPRASVWYHSILRADWDSIDIGEESNVQDGAVLHADVGFPVWLGARVTVGHNATLHGCHVDDDVLIGMGAVVLNGSRIGSGSILAAGTVVPENRHVPARSVVAGSSATLVRTATRADLHLVSVHAQANLGLTGLHRLPEDPTGPAGGHP